MEIATMIKSYTFKLANMRKARKFVTYPRKSATDPVIVQAEGCIGRFDPATGKGVLNVGPTSAHYGFLHLTLGAEPFDFPAEFVMAAIEAGAVSSSGQVALVG